MAPTEQSPVSKLYFMAVWRCSTLPSLPGRAWGSSLNVNIKFWNELLYFYFFFLPSPFPDLSCTLILSVTARCSALTDFTMFEKWSSSSMCDERFDVFFTIGWLLSIELFKHDHVYRDVACLLLCNRCLNLAWYADRPKSTFFSLLTTLTFLISVFLQPRHSRYFVTKLI